MKGGVGKTTLAVNIADCLATRHNKRILLIDIDPQFNATQCLMGGQQYIDHLSGGKDTIIDVFDKETKIKVSTIKGSDINKGKSLSDIETLQVKNNFKFLPGSLDLYRLEIAPGEGRENRLKKFLEANEDDFDFVIIDTPPTPSLWMTSALIASDYYLIPVKADPISLTGIDLLNNIVTEKMENLDLSLKCAGLVLTLTESNTNIYNDAKTKLNSSGRWKKYLFKKELPKRTAVAGSQLKNFILDLQDSTVKSALTGIVDEMLGRIK